MTKRTHWELQKAILRALKDDGAVSYSELERVVDTNWQTVRDHCRNLVVFGAAVMVGSKVQRTRKGSEVAKRL